MTVTGLALALFVNTYVHTHQGFCCGLGKQTYAVMSPVTTKDASCLNASRLSINKSASDFLQYTFSKAAAYSESCSSCCDCQPRAH